MGVPQRLLEFSPTAMIHAVVVVYSTNVHAPVLALTVNTTPEFCVRPCH